MKIAFYSLAAIAILFFYYLFGSDFFIYKDILLAQRVKALELRVTILERSLDERK